MKFRRKSQVTAEELDDASQPQEPARGPFDAEDLPDDGVTRADLGSLLIEPSADRELRLQVEESTGKVQAVMLAGPDGALELRAFAAPRNGDLWSEVRPQIAADMTRRGGTATEVEGPFGVELQCQLATQLPDGRTGTQHSRIIGVNGSRWLLRATLIGGPAREPETAADWEHVITRVAVRRGEGAMPVGEALPVSLPDNARKVQPAQRTAQETGQQLTQPTAE